MASHVEPQLAAPEPFEAMLCVEIIRACGLQAAVNEASLWLGGGALPCGLNKHYCRSTALPLKRLPFGKDIRLSRFAHSASSCQ